MLPCPDNTRHNRVRAVEPPLKKHEIEDFAFMPLLSSKIRRITNEIFSVADTGRFQSLLDSGWEIKHDKGTAYVSLHHERGGSMSLLEVKTYGTELTTGEADEVARIVAELLQERFGQFG